MRATRWPGTFTARKIMCNFDKIQGTSWRSLIRSWATMRSRSLKMNWFSRRSGSTNSENDIDVPCIALVRYPHRHDSMPSQRCSPKHDWQLFPHSGVVPSGNEYSRRHLDHNLHTWSPKSWSACQEEYIDYSSEEQSGHRVRDNQFPSTASFRTFGRIVF